jgi:hypothetical protein
MSCAQLLDEITANQLLATTTNKQLKSKTSLLALTSDALVVLKNVIEAIAELTTTSGKITVDITQVVPVNAGSSLVLFPT